MLRWTRHFVFTLAMFALAGCHSTAEVWKNEIRVEDVPTGPEKVEAESAGGMLKVSMYRPVRETTTPVLRLYLVHETLESTIDWEIVGMTTLYVLGSLLIALGYGVVAVSAGGSSG